jgi:hypothetical protein
MKQKTKNALFFDSSKSVISKKAQTATEYLIILAVVIVIALLVVSVLGGIPSIGGGASDKTKLLSLQSEAVGVSNLAVTDNGTILILQNNHLASVEVESVFIDKLPCVSDVDFPKRLKSGETYKLTCGNGIIDIVSTVPDVNIVWEDTKTNAQYVTYENQEQLTAGECLWADDLSGCLKYYVRNGCGDGTVLHTLTGLCFERDLGVDYNSTYDYDDDDFMNWTMALQYCDDLVLGGHDDWYLPSLNEFSFIRDLANGDCMADSGNTNCDSDPAEVPFIVGGVAGGSTVFDNYQGVAIYKQRYWTSSGGNEVLYGSPGAWLVYLHYGHGSYGFQAYDDARAVCSRRN